MTRSRKKTRSGARRLDTIAAGQFKARCLELMDRVRERKVEYVITKHGRPVAKLVPCEESDVPCGRGAMAGTLVVKGDIVSPDPESWGEYA